MFASPKPGYYIGKRVTASPSPTPQNGEGEKKEDAKEKKPAGMSVREIENICARLSGPENAKKCLTASTLAGKTAYTVRTHFVSVLEGINVTNIVSGLDHVMVMTDRPEKNTVLTFGRGDFGQTGHGSIKHDSAPLPLEELKSKKIRNFFCGANHSIVLTENGELFSWGQGSKGQLGHGRKTKEVVPTLIASLRRCHILQVACGGAHTLALTSAREVYSWGSGARGQLGHGDLADTASPQPLRVLHGIDIKNLFAGDGHSAALTNFGEVFTWGDNQYGQLGHGDDGNRSTPLPIKDLQSARNSVHTLNCGSDHMIAILYNGEIVGWGRNTFGQLGLGNFTDEFRPRKIESLIPLQIASVCCGSFHTVAVTETGMVFTFGRGELGALGHMYCKTIALPKRVESLTEYQIVKAACGLNHTLVLTSEGKVVSFGRGSYGQLGHGSGKRPPIPPANVVVPEWLLPIEKREGFRRHIQNKVRSQIARASMERPMSCPPSMSISREVEDEEEEQDPFPRPSTSQGFERRTFAPHPGKLRPTDRVSRSTSSSPQLFRTFFGDGGEMAHK